MMRQTSEVVESLHNLREHREMHLMAEDVRGEFSELKYWLTQHALSLLVNDRENANEAIEQLDLLLLKLDESNIVLSSQLRHDSSNFVRDMDAAIAAYIEDQRVLGNALVSQARKNASSFDARIQEFISEQSLVAQTQSEKSIKSGLARVNELTNLLYIIPVLAFVASLILSRSVTGPLTNITKALRALRNGNLDFHVPVQRSDELMEMSSALEQLRQNIKERARLLEDVESARNEAELASKAKSQFLAMMSHEIRTPLNGVMGMAELMLKNGELTAEQSRQVALISRSGHILRALVDDVIDLARVEQGKLSFVSSPYQPQSLLEEVVAMIGSVAESKGLAVEIRVGSQVPKFVEGDISRVRQILFNLAGNAVKFTEKGSVEMHVSTLEDKQNKLAIEYSVYDTGRGMTPEEIKKVFEPMFTGATSTPHNLGSSGLGLSITLELVKAMNGKIAVESELGVGSVFRVQLPLVEVPNRETASTENLAKISSESLRVLLVEDDPVNQEIVSGLLRSDGHSVVLAESGEKAISFVKSSAYDLILMDIRLPGLDGVETTKLIREFESRQEITQHTPIVALSAYMTRDDLNLFLDAGMQDALRKPLSASELSSELQKFAGSIGKFYYLRNNEILNEIKSTFSEDKYIEMVELFHQNTLNLREQMVDALEQGDNATAADAAHRLAGSLGSFGELGVASEFRKVERQLREGEKLDSVAMEELWKKVDLVVEQICKF